MEAWMPILLSYRLSDNACLAIARLLGLAAADLSGHLLYTTNSKALTGRDKVLVV